MTNKASKQNSVDPKKARQGFTLIEVLIAIVILSVALLGMSALTVGIINGNAFSKNLSTATTLARDKMEDIRRLGYSGSPTTETPDTEAYGTITNASGDILPEYAAYERVTVADMYTAGTVWPPDGMKAVTVTVNWKDPKQIVHSVILKTSLAK